MTMSSMTRLDLAIETERQRMIFGWVFAGLFFLVAFISSFAFGTPNEDNLALGVPIMVVLSSVLIVLSTYIYYVSNPEVKE